MKHPRTRIIPRSKLDTAQWNAHLEASVQGRIYGHSQYLDVVAPGWQALVLEDSNSQWLAAMPLNVKRKWGIVPYIYPAPLCQQWGPYLAAGVDTDVLHNLLRSLPFSVDTVLKLAPDFAPEMHKLGSEWQVKPRTNQILRRPKELPIITPFLNEIDTREYQIPPEIQASIYAKLFPDKRTKINKASKINMVYFRLCNSPFQRTHPSIAKDLNNLDGDFSISTEFEKVTGELGLSLLLTKLYSAFSKQGRILEASTREGLDLPMHCYGYYLIDRYRYYSLAIIRNPDIKSSPGVTYMHYHTILLAWATGRDFDFEGSDIPGVQSFNASFGAETETYWEIRRQNRLLRLRKA